MISNNYLFVPHRFDLDNWIDLWVGSGIHEDMHGHELIFFNFVDTYTGGKDTTVLGAQKNNRAAYRGVVATYVALFVFQH